MNLQEITNYIKNKPFSSLFEIKEKFNLSDQQINILIPFISSMGISINKLTMEDCDSCSIKKYCTKNSCEIKGDLHV
ncbi:hypothetical protein [Geotoga petraea]|jgi:hypothetical protein|uniref:Uncharacterized protein n=1 Tax=Geotoga petraea TaxID=28234 RepID=A0A1G6M7H6_9BACT|nr:hypothetical protein [Geotoga petraea]MDK2946311.1 hypothetical protein [Geotoga sp.]TGG87486.1 hypothetical protein E4650_06995 [Geotoga petraea]SDC51297.1 hypothetical protein SAMN04488588_1255 [Geotoga petraea]